MRERDWEKAIEIVEKEYKDKVVRGSAQWWSLVLGVFKRMQGRKPLRRLKRAKILKKNIDLVSLLAPFLTPQFPISLDQLFLDFPAPFTVAPINETLASHYQALLPHVSMATPSPNPPVVFVPLSGDEVFRLSHEENLALTGTDELPEWVEAFNKLWYLAILCGILDGALTPRSEAGLKWMLQLTANPVLRAYIGNSINSNAEQLNDECKKYRDIRLGDALRLHHRFGAFQMVSPTMGVFIKPSSIGRVWCIRLHCLSNPLFPSQVTPASLHKWWLNLINSFLPCQYLSDGEERGWLPLIGGVLTADEIGALVIFSGFGIARPNLSVIEIDLDTPYNLVVEVAKKVIKKG